MRIICCFCCDLTVSRTAKLLGLCRNSITIYYDNLRGEFQDELDRLPIKFDTGTIFEVDELLIKHIKFGPGRFIHQWIIGLLERDTGKVVFLPVPDRSSDSLISIIQEYIPAHSLVFTDDWGSYRSLNSLGYRHYHVNHSAKEYSRDERIDGDIVKVTINTLEGMNRVVRQRFSNKSRRNSERIELILGELMYRYSGRSLFYPFKATALNK